MEKPTEILSDALPPHSHCIDNHSPLEDDTWNTQNQRFF